MATKKTADDAALQELEELRAFKAKAETQALRDQGISEKYENYKPKKGEEGMVHLLFREPSLIGRRDVSVPFHQIFSEVAYRRNVLPNFNGLGYELVKVLHIPDGVPTPEEYAKEQAEKAAKKANR